MQYFACAVFIRHFLSFMKGKYVVDMCRYEIIIKNRQVIVTKTTRGQDFQIKNTIAHPGGHTIKCNVCLNCDYLLCPIQIQHTC